MGQISRKDHMYVGVLFLCFCVKDKSKVGVIFDMISNNDVGEVVI